MHIRALIDIREDDLYKELGPYTAADASDGWVAESRRLDVGDIVFCSSDNDVPIVVLERKTAADLGASQKDGRYREQRARLYALRGSGSAIGYIIEAPAWSPTLSRVWCNGSFNEGHLQQAIVRMQLKHGLPILQSTGLKDTVSWIRRIAKMLQADVGVFKSEMATSATAAAVVYTEAIHVKKAANNSQDRVFTSMLLTIPGVGRTAADSITVAAKASFPALMEMSIDTIACLKAGKRKIGKILGKTIYDVLHSAGAVVDGAALDP
jgi:ERCC4-type nuclease